MKKSYLPFTLIMLLNLVGCNSTNNSFSPFFDKPVGNSDFAAEGNMIAGDYVIDGILEEGVYNDENAALHIQIGGNELVQAIVDAYVIFGNNGLTVGFQSTDRFVASSTEYSNPHFVVNSDDVEFYIDTLNNRGQYAQKDDFAFLINPEGYIEMRNGIGSSWRSWSGLVDFGTSINGTVNNDSDYDEGWSAKLFLPYSSFGFSQDSDIGVAFGTRDKTTNLKTSEWTGWTPDPQVIDTYVTLNENGILIDTAGEYTIASGGYTHDEINDIYTSTTANSLAIHSTNTMFNGTYNADMYLGPILKGDNGLVFRVQPSETGLFFENEGSSYYFFFINFEGTAILGKTENGVWSIVQESVCDYNLNSWNNLKVVVIDNSIFCFINDVLYLSVTDSILSGMNMGFRAGAKGIKFKNIEVSTSTKIGNLELNQIEGYSPASGTWIHNTDDESKIQAFTLNGSGAMIVRDNDTCFDGTLSMLVEPNQPADNGIVFRLNENGQSNYWETGVSYYYFFISNTSLAYLARVSDVGQTWTSLGEIAIPNYSVNQAYTLSVTLAGSSIKCYIDSQLYISTNDSVCTGNKYGIRVGSTEAIVSLITRQ